MLSRVSSLFVSSFQGLVIFLLGFMIGTAIDILFFALYNKWDPDKKNHVKLVPLALVQLYIIIFLLGATAPVKQLGSAFSFGLMSSQVFLFVHAVETISNTVYDRK